MTVLTPQKPNNLTGVVDTLLAETGRDKIRVEEILDSLNRKGFGPLLIAPCLLALLPTGAIPGMPALCGVLIVLISVQLLAGLRHPWMPRRLLGVSFRAQRLRNGIRRIRPYTQAVDRHVHNRLSFLADNEISKRLTALVITSLGLAMIFIGFIPFFPALFALPVLFFALGLSVHDGVLLAVGYIILFLCLGVMPMMIKG